MTEDHGEEVSLPFRAKIEVCLLTVPYEWPAFGVEHQEQEREVFDCDAYRVSLGVRQPNEKENNVLGFGINGKILY